MNTVRTFRNINITIRLLVVAFFLAPFLVLPYGTAQAIGLKKNSVVTDNTIKLGDVFYGLDKDSDRVLGMAPAPGQEMILNARTLLRIALALDLPWRPAHTSDMVTLRRQATVIDGDTIRDNLKNALADKNVLGNYMVSIPQQYTSIVLPYDQPATMDVSDVNIDRDHKTFTAMISAPSINNPIQQMEVKGSIEPVIKVPVLVDNVENGRLIKESDIKMINIGERDYSKDMFVSAQDLVGMTPRRMIAAGRPVRQTDVEAPTIVERGELVILSLNEGALSLSTQAKALENGAKGDIIRVVNTASNQTVQAKVTGEKQVQVVSN